MQVCRKLAFLVLPVLVLAVFIPARGTWAQVPPDLTPDAGVGFTFLGKDENGNCLGKLRITVKNKGGSNSGQFVVAVTINQVVYTVTVPGVQNNASTTITPDVVIPVGTNLLRILVDATNTVAEGNEANNSVVQYVTCATNER